MLHLLRVATWTLHLGANRTLHALYYHLDAIKFKKSCEPLCGVAECLSFILPSIMQMAPKFGRPNIQ